MSLFKSPEEFMEIIKKNNELACDFASKSFDSFEKFNDLNIKYSKTALSDAKDTIEQASDIRDPKDFASLAQSFYSPLPSKFTEYFKSAYKINSDTIKDFVQTSEDITSKTNNLIVDSFDELSKKAPAGTEGVVAMTKSTIAASSSTYDVMSKAAKKAFEVVDNNVKASTKNSDSASASQSSSKSSRSRKAA